MKKLILLLACSAGLLAQNPNVNGDRTFLGKVDTSTAIWFKLPLVATDPVGVCTVANVDVQSIATGSVFNCNPTGLVWRIVGGLVSSVFGRTGVVVAGSGDYTAAQVTNAVDQTGSYSNPGWVTALAGAKITGIVAGNEVPLTFTGPLSRTVNSVACVVATGSVPGCLAAADWTTFNGKQAALGFTPLNPANNLSEVTAATARTNLGLAAVATSSSATDITAGTLAAARMLNAGVHTGDVSGTFPATLVKQIHETLTSVNFAASPYTVLAADSYIYCDASGGAVVINLPATSGSGREITIKKTDATANTCTLTRAGSDVIDGATTAALSTQYVAAKVADRATGFWDRTHVNQLVGDVTGASTANVVGRINGTALSGLGTGILKNTTATGVPSIAVANTDYLAPQSTVIDPRAYGVKANGHFVADATLTSGSPIVTCPNADCKFLTTAVAGQTVFAGQGLLGGAFALGETTITSVDSDTQITVGINAAISKTAAGILVWGDVDEGASAGAYMTAWNAFTAASIKGSAVFQLPCGISLVRGGISSASLVAPATMPTIQGCGPTSSIIIPTPTFSWTTPGCSSLHNGFKQCFFGGFTLSNAQGGLVLRDFEIFGAGINSASACPTTSGWSVTGQDNQFLSLYNVYVNSWCTNNANLTGIVSASPAFMTNVVVDAAGSVGIQINGGVQPVNLYNAFAGDNTKALVASGGIVNSYGGTYVAGFAVDITNARFSSFGEEITGSIYAHGTAILDLVNGVEDSTNCGGSGCLNLASGTSAMIQAFKFGAATETYTVAGSGTLNLDPLSTIVAGSSGTIASTVLLKGPIANGTTAMATAAIASGTCAVAVSAAATNVLATDAISVTFASDPTGVTGYGPNVLGMLTIIPYPSAASVNFKVCNNTNASITPGAISLNWKVVR